MSVEASPRHSTPPTKRAVPSVLGRAAKRHAEEASASEALSSTHLCYGAGGSPWCRCSPSHSWLRQGKRKHVLAFQSGIPKSTKPRAQFSKQHLEASKEPCPSVSDGIQMVRCNGSNSLGVFLGMLSRLRLSPLTVTLSSSAWECRH